MSGLQLKVYYLYSTDKLVNPIAWTFFRERNLADAIHHLDFKSYKNCQCILSPF